MNNDTTMDDAARRKVATTMTDLIKVTRIGVLEGSIEIGMLHYILDAAIRTVGAVNEDGCATVTITFRDNTNSVMKYTFKHWNDPSEDIVEISECIAVVATSMRDGELDAAAYFNGIA